MFWGGSKWQGGFRLSACQATQWKPFFIPKSTEAKRRDGDELASCFLVLSRIKGLLLFGATSSLPKRRPQDCLTGTHMVSTTEEWNIGFCKGLNPALSASSVGFLAPIVVGLIWCCLSFKVETYTVDLSADEGGELLPASECPHRHR